MGRYKAPRKLNPVSFVIGLVLFGSVYSAIQFGPVYYRKWQVKSALSEATSKAYSRRVAPGFDGQNKITQIQEETLQRIKALGVTDPGLHVSVDKTTDQVTAKASYKERIEHPLVGKTTTLWFRPYYTVSLKNED